MTNEQQAKIQQHLRGIAQVLNEIGSGQYEISIDDCRRSAIGVQIEQQIYSVSMSVKISEVIE